VITQTVTLIQLTVQPPKVSLSAETFYAHNAVEAKVQHHHLEAQPAVRFHEGPAEEAIH